MSRFSTNSRSRFDPRKPQAVADVLDRTDAFRALRAGVEQVAALQRDLGALLPDYLASNVEPGFIKDGVLALFAAHNALAARLRHLGPPGARLGRECVAHPRASAANERARAAEAGAHVASGRVRAAGPGRGART